jgi:hypothetical protein
MRQGHQPSDLVFFTLEIVGIIVLSPSTQSLHIPPLHIVPVRIAHVPMKSDFL